MSRGLRDVLFGLVALGFGALLWWETTKPQYQADKVQDYGFDPAFFPRILIVIWIVLSAFMILRALRTMNLPMDEQNWGALAGSTAIAFGYVMVMDYLGFLFSSIAFAFAIMMFLGFRRPVIVTLIALLFPLVTWYSFVFLLKIPLPTSPWFVRI